MTNNDSFLISEKEIQYEPNMMEHQMKNSH